MSIPTWSRGSFQPGGSPADLHLLIFAGQPLPASLELSRQRDGLPLGEAPGGIYLSEIQQDEAPGWFARFQQGPGLAAAQQALDQDLDALLAATRCFELAGEERDPADLRYLQHAWGVVRRLCQLGFGPVHDRHARRWWSRGQVLGWAPERPFDLSRELGLERLDPGDERLGQLLLTRGLAKFGRPDLVLVRAQPGDEQLIWSLASALADGAQLPAGVAMENEQGLELHLLDYQPDDLLPELGLANEALVIFKG